MKIMVLVTTYNRPAYLRKVLEGYLHQTRAPDELVVADDGSGEETRQVIEQFRARASFPVLHAWQEHQGIRLSRLRNLGTRQSTADYLIYTDGDCVPGPHFVADHERLARPGWFVQGARMWVRYKAIPSFTGRETPSQLLKMWMSGGLTNVLRAIRIPALWIEHKHLRKTKTCNLAVFRSDVLRINGFNEDFLGYLRQDTEFCLRLMRAGVRRRDPLFSAVSFHLEHEKEINSEDRKRNDELLERARTAPIFAPRGLFPPSGESDVLQAA
jgi:GT2 family glycosyltransferase